MKTRLPKTLPLICKFWGSPGSHSFGASRWVRCHQHLFAVADDARHRLPDTLLPLRQRQLRGPCHDSAHDPSGDGYALHAGSPEMELLITLRTRGS